MVEKSSGVVDRCPTGDLVVQFQGPPVLVAAQDDLSQSALPSLARAGDEHNPSVAKSFPDQGQRVPWAVARRGESAIHEANMVDQPPTVWWVRR